MDCNNCKNKFGCLTRGNVPFSSWNDWRINGQVNGISVGSLFAKNEADWILSYKQPELFCINVEGRGTKFDGSPSEFLNGTLFKRDL